MARTIIAVALLAAALGGCASGSARKITEQDYEITPLPKNYKRMIANYLESELGNRGPFEVGDAYQDSCRVGLTGRYYGWAVPIRFGTKKQSPVKTPEEVIWFNYDTVQMVSRGGADYCTKA